MISTAYETRKGRIKGVPLSDTEVVVIFRVSTGTRLRERSSLKSDLGVVGTLSSRWISNLSTFRLL